MCQLTGAGLSQRVAVAKVNKTALPSTEWIILTRVAIHLPMSELLLTLG
jgi:hypothetical protein